MFLLTAIALYFAVSAEFYKLNFQENRSYSVMKMDVQCNINEACLLKETRTHLPTPHECNGWHSVPVRSEQAQLN